MGWMNALFLYRLRLELCLWWNSLVGGCSFHDRCTALQTREWSSGSEGIFTASPCFSLAGRGCAFFVQTVFAVFQPRHVSFWYMGRRLILSVGTVVGVWNGKLFRTFHIISKTQFPLLVLFSCLGFLHGEYLSAFLGSSDLFYCDSSNFITLSLARRCLD